MAAEISDKLLEITQFCGKNGISVEYTSYGAQRNVMEQSITHGERSIRIELGKPEAENLLSELNEFLKLLEDSL